MPTTYTPLLGFSLPTTGELSGTWGDVTNASLTNLADSSIAGTTTLSTDADVTLTTTVGAANQARQAILLCSGARTAQRNITAPASSKTYAVTNATTGGFGVLLRGVGPTAGVVIPAGRTYNVAWTGADFAIVGTDAGQLSGTVPITQGGTGQTTAGAALTALGGAPIASPTFTGVPAAPTPGTNINTTQIPTSAWVNTWYAPKESPAFTTTMSLGTLGYSAVNALASWQSSVAGTNQVIVRNSNTGTAASSGFIVNNNLSTDTTNYGEFGINSSSFTGSGAMNAASATYVAAINGPLVLGTLDTNNVRVVVNSGATDAITVNGTTGVTTLGAALPVGSGGTGITAVGASGNILTSNGTSWVSSVLPSGSLPSLTGNTLRFLQVNAGETAVQWAAVNSTLSGLTAATGSATLANGNNPIAWNWTQTTASQTGFSIGETTASTGGAGAQVLLKVGTLAASTAKPLQAVVRGVTVIDVDSTGNLALGTNTFIPGGAAGVGVQIYGTDAASSGNAGGGIDLTTGSGLTTGVGGSITMLARAGGTGGVSGNISLSIAAATSARAGIITLTGGISNAAQSGNSGGIVLTAGAAGAVASVAGGPIVITAGAGSSTTTGGIGGAVNITAGAGGLAAAGGALTLTTGSGGASAAAGNLNLNVGTTNLGTPAALTSNATRILFGSATAVSIGVGNTANSGIALGNNITVSASNSVALGSYSYTGQIGKFAFSSGQIATLGDAQYGIAVLKASTTGSVVTMTSDLSAANSSNQLIVGTGQVMAFTGTLIGKQTGSANIAAYEIKGTLVNNAGTVTMPTGTLTLIGTDSIALTTAPSLAADNTNKGLGVVSGAKTATNIRWVATITSSELTYA